MECNLQKATEIAREWIRENRIINLFYHMFRIEQAKQIDKESTDIGVPSEKIWLVVCSLQEDFNKRVYYVFIIDFNGVILKLGMGDLEKDTIKLKEYKLKWEKKN